MSKDPCEELVVMLCNNLPNFALCRRQISVIQADDIILANIRSNSMGGVDFDMYVQFSDNMVLDRQALLQAVEVTYHDYCMYNYIQRIHDASLLDQSLVWPQSMGGNDAQLHVPNLVPSP